MIATTIHHIDQAVVTRVEVHLGAKEGTHRLCVTAYEAGMSDLCLIGTKDQLEEIGRQIDRYLQDLQETSVEECHVP